MMAPSCDTNRINGHVPPPAPPRYLQFPLRLLEAAFGNCEVRLTRCDNDPKLSSANRRKLQSLKDGRSEIEAIISGQFSNGFPLQSANVTSISFTNCPYPNFEVVLVHDENVNEGWVIENGKEPKYYVKCNTSDADKRQHIEVPPPIKEETDPQKSSISSTARIIKISRRNGRFICGYCKMWFTRRCSAKIHQIRSCTENGFSVAVLKSKRQQNSQHQPKPNLTTLTSAAASAFPTTNVIDDLIDIKPDVNISTEIANMIKNATLRVKSHVNPKNHICKTCGNGFTRKRHLEMHVLSVHAKLKPFKCVWPMCESKFARREHIKAHVIAVHTKEKPFKCKICNKAFASMSNRNSHIRCHSDVRAFGCTICFKRYRRRFDLLNHLRVHTGEKPFSCTICAKSFTNSNLLRMHVETHQGKQFQCPYCFVKLSRKTNLQNHFLRFHPEKVS